MVVARVVYPAVGTSTQVRPVDVSEGSAADGDQIPGGQGARPCGKAGVPLLSSSPPRYRLRYFLEIGSELPDK